MTQSLAQPLPQEFVNVVQGTWGEFSTRSGSVTYLMANARLGPMGTGREHRLTGHLRPVREVLDVAQMDFDELLQRDLDDHRVATELVPYLLKEAETGPAFFPPILTVLLPFERRRAASCPNPDNWHVIEENGLPYMQRAYGDAFRERRLIEEGSEREHEVRLGEVAWNPERIKNVVIDGQHRAMALLAIDRTIRGTWEEDARSARYRHFYEERVEAVLEEFGVESIEMVQVPVTVCWFPGKVGTDREPHQAARQLFVDVNREARPPSLDRVVLLSDDDMLNILTRSVLNGLRLRQGDPPLYAVEYDNPIERHRTARWSTITSLLAIRNMVKYCVFGPRKYIDKMNLAVRGRESAGDTDAFMRDQLRVEELFQHELKQVSVGSTRRDQLGRKEFPRAVIPSLREEFVSGWGAGILELLAGLLPFVAHYKALRELDENWEPADPSAVDALAREAVFEGVGMYWTLRASFEHWRSITLSTERENQPEVVMAWNRVRAKGDEFRRARAMHYLGTDDSTAVQKCDSLYDVLATQACQGSLALLLATIADRASISGSDILELARALTRSINAGLTSVSSSGDDRRLFFASGIEQSLNMIGDMTPARAVEYRYFWLELLCETEAGEMLLAGLDSLDNEILVELRDIARARYVQQLVDERVAEKRRYDRSRSRTDLLTPVTLDVTGSMEAALLKWFDIEPEKFREWAKEAEFAFEGDDEGISDDEQELLDS